MINNAIRNAIFDKAGSAPAGPNDGLLEVALAENERLRARLDAAVAALKALVARVQTVKIDLDATVAIGEPVPEASASLTWPLSDALLAISAIDAAIAKKAEFTPAELVLMNESGRHARAAMAKGEAP